MCGEKKPMRSSKKDGVGSPPRVRGKVSQRVSLLLDDRITPACAGKRDTRLSGQRVRRDHPRVCGEKISAVVTVCGLLGSPPRVRGKANISQQKSGRFRITPACAGKSISYFSLLFKIQDHPRVCGEKDAGDDRHRAFPGSPPRVRGKGELKRKLPLRTGITPACAGKSSCGSFTRKCGTDHPRVCGEKYSTTYAFFSAPGSPPRVRGKVVTLGIYGVTNGITPACAGKSIAGFRILEPCKDHPRVCGEKLQERLEYIFAEGSPPRVRGKARRRRWPRAPGGITPACAGKSGQAPRYGSG